MGHGMSGAAGAVMIAMMIMMMAGMSGFALAYLGRAVPAPWRERIRQAIRRPAARPAGTGEEGTR